MRAPDPTRRVPAWALRLGWFGGRCCAPVTHIVFFFGHVHVTVHFIFSGRSWDWSPFWEESAVFLLWLRPCRRDGAGQGAVVSPRPIAAPAGDGEQGHLPWAGSQRVPTRSAQFLLLCRRVPLPLGASAALSCVLPAGQAWPGFVTGMPGQRAKALPWHKMGQRAMASPGHAPRAVTIHGPQG